MARTLSVGGKARLMDRPELVEVPCPACGCSPVEILKKERNSRYLWCPRCRAIWVVDRSSLPDRSPK